MIVLHDPDTLLHETAELLGSKLIPALESPDRIREVVAGISRSRHSLRLVSSSKNRKQLLDLIRQTHGLEYLLHLENVFTQWRDAGLIEAHDSILPECFPVPNKTGKVTEPPKDIYARTGYFAFDMSSGIMKDSFTAIMASANLAAEAVRQLREYTDIREVMALCRPPGHHCDGYRAGGYCYVNNVAVAVSAWRQHSPDARICILDIDFHHGNGTQDIFYNDPKVFYTSIHGENEFPYYTGCSDETGEGEAVGMNLNLPLATGSSVEAYEEKLDIALEALRSFAAEFMVVSLGFDTFRLDPLGSFQIDTDDYAAIARSIRQKLLSMPALILLEGGYSIEHLGNNLVAFLDGWETAAQR